MAEDRSDEIFPYSDDFKKLKSTTDSTQNIIETHQKIFGEIEELSAITSVDIFESMNIIKKSLDDIEVQDILKEVPLLSTTFPNYMKMQKKMNAFYQRMVSEAIITIKEVVEDNDKGNTKLDELKNENIELKQKLSKIENGREEKNK